jgi:hypothetical protein
LVQALSRGATNLGILVAKARHQQFERAPVPGRVQVFEGFPAYLRAI